MENKGKFESNATLRGDCDMENKGEIEKSGISLKRVASLDISEKTGQYYLIGKDKVRRLDADEGKKLNSYLQNLTLGPPDQKRSAVMSYRKIEYILLCGLMQIAEYSALGRDQIDEVILTLDGYYEEHVKPYL